MHFTKEHRMLLPKVMRKAAAVDLFEAIETELLREHGGRRSPGRTFTGLGEVKAIKEWDPDIPYEAIDWDLSRAEYPMRRLALEREKESCIDWCLVQDAGVTMDFGTDELTKRAFGAALGAIFSQSALYKHDRVATVIFDDARVGLILEGASAEEMALVAIAYDPDNPPIRSTIDRRKCGLSASMKLLPDAQGIVPVMSDFLPLLEKDRRGRLTERALDAREALGRAARYHKVVACVIEDPRERKFPNAQAEVTIQDTRGLRDTVTYAEANARISRDREAKLAELDAYFTETRIQYAVFSTDDEPRELRTKVLKLMARVAAMAVW